MSDEQLTEAQAKVHGFIVEFQASHGGIPPTVREIAVGTGVTSTNGVAEMLRRLERKGFLWFIGKGRARGWTTMRPVNL